MTIGQKPIKCCYEIILQEQTKATISILNEIINCLKKIIKRLISSSTTEKLENNYDKMKNNIFSLNLFTKKRRGMGRNNFC